MTRSGRPLPHGFPPWLGLLGVVLWAAPAAALPPGVSVKPVVSGLDFPVSMAVSDDGRTILVTEKAGKVRVVRDGVLAAQPIVTFAPYTQNEAGLGGITLAPDFATTGLVVVSYVPNADRGHIYLSRFEVTASGGRIVNDPWLTLPGDPNT